MIPPFRVREFLRSFPTIFEFEDGDTGFFVDANANRMVFMRKGVKVSELALGEMDTREPESTFEAWRQKFARTEPWRPGRGRDD